MSISTDNSKLEQQRRAQEERDIEQNRLTGKQDELKMQSAQDVLKNLKIVLKEGEVPGTEVINDVLLKAEQFLVQQAQSARLDSDTRKTLEDIALLLGATKQVARNQDLGDRLQRITEETVKAMKEVNEHSLSLSTKSKEATLEMVGAMETWRPLFQQIITSREFREMILDTVKIIRKIFGKHKDAVSSNLGEKVEQKFIAGENPTDIAKQVGEKAKETLVAPKSEQKTPEDNIPDVESKGSKQVVHTPEGSAQLFISDKDFDLLYEDISHILMKLAKTPTYEDAIKRLIHLYGFLKKQITSGGRSTQSIHAKRAQLETKDLLTSFTGQQALDNFIDSLKALIEKTDEPKTNKYLDDLKSFILDTKTAERMSEKETKERIRKFAREGRELIAELKYADELDEFLDASSKLMDSIKHNETLTVLRHHAGLVADDLSIVDNQGHVQLDTDLLGKLRTILLPVIAESLKYIPIPRIESNNEDRDFWVDNIVLCGYDVVPDNIRIQMESDSIINVRKIKTDRAYSHLVLTLNNIKTEIKNLDFFYNKKTFPTFTEQGKATLGFPGDGATLTIEYWVEQPAGKAPTFHEGRVYFQIHNFDIQFDKKTLDHDILVPMLTSMFKYQLQRQIEVTVENNLGGLVNGIAENLTKAMVDINRPLTNRLDKLRDVIKTTEVGKIIENRKQILE